VSQTSRFIDSFGFLWQIMEVPRTDARGMPVEVADLSGWLYFFSRGCTMVLREYPADWNDLEWVGLEKLRMRATVMSDDVTRLPATPGSRVPSFASPRALADLTSRG
jgi:hypothetical protein